MTAPASPTPVRLGRDDVLSAMSQRFNLFFRWFARRFFRHFDLDDATVARLRELEERGSVVYVMRYASRLDYFLFNALFLRKGLRLSQFANGIRFYYYRPALEALGIAFRRSRGVSVAEEHERAIGRVRSMVRDGESMFLFLRTATLRGALRGRRGAIAAGERERELLEEAVSLARESEREVSLVPLALFWRKGPRARRRFLNLFYGAQIRPSDLSKVTSFVTTYRGLFVKVGDSVDLRGFVESRRDQTVHDVARTVRRSIQTYLYREEKVVEGPTLKPLHRVQDIVLGDVNVAEAIRSHAGENHGSIEKSRAVAGKMFREVAANMNSMFLAILNFVFGAIMRRLFAAIEVSGIERVAEHAKQEPMVLVPSHRSYFDFVIISCMFYDHHLVPPHIAARENMSFGPFGFIFRRCGAFFMRRSFDDPLYKEVFRSYVGHLIREGFTQEFFIEGGRSRTGKTLAPRLGMLSWNLEGFLSSSRRDLSFVPIAITYERLVEEGAMVGELEGAPKEEESMMGLMRARTFLRRRFGSVHVNLGEPFSLAEELGDRRERFAQLETEEVRTEKRLFTEGLGNRIAEAINWAAVANATSVAACGMLGQRRRGSFRRDLIARMQQVVDLLQLQDVNITPALAADGGEYHESISALLESNLVRLSHDPRGEILYYEESKRRALDLYRNSIVQFIATPSFLARRLLLGPAPGAPAAEIAEGLDFFYYEFFVPMGEVFEQRFDRVLQYFKQAGWAEEREGALHATAEGRASLEFLALQTQGFVEVYFATVVALLGNEGEISANGLQKAATEQFSRSTLVGEVERIEASNPVTFGNAVDLLVRRKVLERSSEQPGGDRPRDTVYEPGSEFEELPRIHRRLATALSAG
ncbi:1-acyl-sn-glycerol-3-phosphate acyltransferase [Myxococcota bacterium]|nr:1-acyl-sn-glycerol-3-phosphate acyltransferase [Myxococcota bacterium]